MNRVIFFYLLLYSLLLGVFMKIGKFAGIGIAIAGVLTLIISYVTKMRKPDDVIIHEISSNYGLIGLAFIVFGLFVFSTLTILTWYDKRQYLEEKADEDLVETFQNDEDYQEKVQEVLEYQEKIENQ